MWLWVWERQWMYPKPYDTRKFYIFTYYLLLLHLLCLYVWCLWRSGFDDVRYKIEYVFHVSSVRRSNEKLSCHFSVTLLIRFAYKYIYIYFFSLVREARVWQWNKMGEWEREYWNFIQSERNKNGKLWRLCNICNKNIAHIPFHIIIFLFVCFSSVVVVVAFFSFTLVPFQF